MLAWSGMHAQLLACGLLGPARDLDGLEDAIRAMLDEEHVPGVGAVALALVKLAEATSGSP